MEITEYYDVDALDKILEIDDFGPLSKDKDKDQKKIDISWCLKKIKKNLNGDSLTKEYSQKNDIGRWYYKEPFGLLYLPNPVRGYITKKGTKDLEGKPFYLAVYEKYDLVLKRGLVRIPKITKYRPYPEQDSMVFHVYPNENLIYFCWELPHRSQMINIVNNPDLYPEKHVTMIRHWENYRLEHYGFTKDKEGYWIENTFFRGDEDISSNKPTEKLR